MAKKLDFETVSRYYLTLEARDQAPGGQHRSETTIMTINVRDSDDLGKFILLLAQVDKESVMYELEKYK